MLHDAVARLADVPSWDGHDASRARVAMPLKAGGLGIDMLANPDHAAVAGKHIDSETAGFERHGNASA